MVIHVHIGGECRARVRTLQEVARYRARWTAQTPRPAWRTIVHDESEDGVVLRRLDQREARQLLEMTAALLRGEALETLA